MDQEKLKEALKSAVEFKQEGLKLSLVLDGKKILKDVVKEAIDELVADSANPYDDKLWALLEPLVDAKLA